MKKMIVPAILTEKKEEFTKMLSICSGFTDYVQIDIMDGEFVPSRSIIREDLAGVKPAIKSEAHLMVNQPLEWLDIFKEFGSKTIIFHFEIKENHLKIIEEIRKNNLGVGIAINPSTKLADFKFLVDKVDSVLFMSVNPGFYGATFIPAVLDKIKQFKKAYPDKITGIDGGVKLDNVMQVAQSGVDHICIGSAILKAASPKQAYLKISHLVNE